MAETTDPRRQQQDTSALEHELRDLGRRLDYPDDVSLTSAVRVRLNAAPAARVPFWSRWIVTPHRGLASAALALVLLCAVVLAVSPSTRTTIADRLGVPGINISTDETPATPTGADLALGIAVTLPEATEQAGFPLVAPPTALGDPDAVYLNDALAGVQVTYVYDPRSDLSEVGDTGVGVLVMQFVGRTNESFIQKQLGRDSTIDLVSIGGRQGYWITGAPHVFFYQDAAGDIQQETVRLTGNVLLWQDAGRTLRIETALDRDIAIHIAESMTTTP